MTPRLDSDVPVTYCGWNAFEIMRPPRPTANKSDVLTAFISNCNDKSKRLDVIDALAKSGEGLALHTPSRHDVLSTPQTAYRIDHSPVRCQT
jgi:hypothetical protein